MKADRSVVPQSSTLAQNTNVSDNRKGKQKTSGGRDAVRRSVCSNNTLKPPSATRGSRSSSCGDMPTTPDVLGDFLPGTGPVLSATRPTPILTSGDVHAAAKVGVDKVPSGVIM